MGQEKIFLICQPDIRGPHHRGKRDIYLSLHCHHENDFCIKMGSGESQPYPSLPRSLINHAVSVDVKHNNNKKEEESYTSQDQPM